jgi:hypothetical protein
MAGPEETIAAANPRCEAGAEARPAWRACMARLAAAIDSCLHAFGAVPALKGGREEEVTMRIRRMVWVAGLVLAAVASLPPVGQPAPADIEMFALARDAFLAIQAARRARAAELAPRDLRLAEEYYEDGAAPLSRPERPPDVPRAAHRLRLAAAQARLAETRAIEVARERDAAGAGYQYLDTLEADTLRTTPPRPPMAQSATQYRLRQKEAAEARAARRAAEELVERLRGEEG